MNIEENFKRGTIELLLLTLLKKEEKYGYQLSQELQAQSEGEYDLKEATLYPTLYRLNKNEYIADHKVKVGERRTRVYYKITDKGLAYLDELLATYSRITSGIHKVLKFNEH